MEAKIIYNKCEAISEDKPFVAHIIDAIEGDMTFEFKIIRNGKYNNSYTNYHIIDTHNVIITISNVDGYGVKSASPIEIGTYEDKYRLFFSYVVFKQDANWKIEVTFSVKEKKEK